MTAESERVGLSEGEWEALTVAAVAYFARSRKEAVDPRELFDRDPGSLPVVSAGDLVGIIVPAVERLIADRHAALLAELAASRREVEEAQEKGYWIGYGEGKDEAETRDLSFDALTERAEAAEAEVAASREVRARVILLLAKYAGRSGWVGYESARRQAWGEIERDLRAALDGSAGR